MVRSVVGLLLFGAAATEYFFPGWNGFFTDPTPISGDTQRILIAVYVVGGLVLIYARDSNKW